MKLHMIKRRIELHKAISESDYLHATAGAKYCKNWTGFFLNSRNLFDMKGLSPASRYGFPVFLIGMV